MLTINANRIELYNESIILVLFTHFLCHTDLVTNLDVRYYVGWSIIAIIAVNIVFSFGSVIWVSIAQLRDFIKIYRLRRAMILRRQ